MGRVEKVIQCKIEENIVTLVINEILSWDRKVNIPIESLTHIQ